MNKTTSPQSAPGPRRLTRSSDNKMVAGVAGGLSRHFDVDPALVRIAFIGLALFGGSGLLLYLAAWLIVPSDRDQADVSPPVAAPPADDTAPTPPITVQAVV